MQKMNEKLILTHNTLTLRKTKYFFNKSYKKEEKDLVLQKLLIDKYQITRAESMTFLGVSLNENLTWKKHFKYLKNNMTKNILLSFKTTPLKLHY